MTPLKISQLPQFSGDSSGSYILINDASNSVTYIVKKEDFLSGSFYGTASYALNSDSSSYSFEAISASYSFTASYIELAQTSSFVTSSNVYGPYGSDSVLSSSYALTASYALNGGGGSGEPAFPFSGSAVITGSLLVRESFVDFSSASYFVGNLTGSLFGTSSWARNALTASYNYPISVSGSSLYSISPTAGPGFNTQHSIFFGGSAGRLAYYANGSNFIGNQAGFWAYTASQSNFFGGNAGFFAEKANNSNFLGAQSGQSATLAEKSNFFGYQAGAGAVSASYSTLIGFNVGSVWGNDYGKSIGRNNIVIGTMITLPYNYQNGINIGGIIFGSGSYFDSNNAGVSAFSGSANGRIGINQPNPLFSLDVSGSGRYTNGLQITGSVGVTGSLSVDGPLYATSSWATNVLSASYSLTSLTASYSVTASWALDAALTGANAITRVDKSFELGGQLYRNTYVTGTLGGTYADNYDLSGSGFLYVDNTGVYNGNVYAVAVDSLGRIYYGGFFNSYNGVILSGSGSIIRLNADLTPDTTFNAGTGFISASADANVARIVVEPVTNKIFVGGSFTEYSGSPCNNLVKINTDGTVDTSFNVGSGFLGRAQSNITTGIYSLDIDSSGKIIAAGNFNNYSGSARTWPIVKINPDGTLDSNFSTGNNAGNGSVTDMQVEPRTDKIYLSARWSPGFTNYSGSAFRGLIKLNPNGSIDNTFNVGTGFTISSIGGYIVSLRTDSNLNVYAVGYFDFYKGTPSSRIIKISSSGSIDSSFNVGSGLTGGDGFNGIYDTVYVDQYDRAVVIGSFNFYSSSYVGGSVRILSNGTIDTSYNFYNSGVLGNKLISSSGNVTSSAYAYDNAVSLDKKVLYVTQFRTLGGFWSSYYNGVTRKPVGVLPINLSDPELSFQSTQLVYSSDYSTYYTSRSLVDKAYVDRKFINTSLSGSVSITGSLIVSAPITASLFGTSSWSTNSVTASFVTTAQTASFVTTAQTASFVATASWARNAVTASFITTAQTASFVTTAQTASFVATASWARNAITASFITTAQTASFVTTAQTASFVATASWARNAITASFITTAQTASFVTTAQTASFVTTAQTASFVTLAQTASFVATASWARNALTASSADNLVVRQDVTASNVVVTGTITAQTLVVQTITSSVSFVTGSTIFGSLSTDTHQFTGSVRVSENLISPSITASLFGTSSWAESSSFSQNSITASYSFQANSSSYSATASSADNFLIRQDLTGSNATFTSMSVGNLTVEILVSSSTDYSSGSTIFGNDMSNTHQFTGSVFITGSLYATSSWAQTAVTVQDQNFAIVYAIVL